MNSPEFTVLAVILALIFVFGAIWAYKLLESINLLSRKMSRMANLGNFFSENGPKLMKFAASLDEILEGGNKINQDSVLANQRLVQEVIKLNEAVKNIGVMMFPPEPEDNPITQSSINKDYNWALKELIANGVDEERAKQLASEQEYERIYTEGIGPRAGFGG